MEVVVKKWWAEKKQGYAEKRSADFCTSIVVVGINFF
jgi:hypothetical protein